MEGIDLDGAGLTRGRFLRRVAGGGAILMLGGPGGSGLLDAGEAWARTQTEAPEGMRHFHSRPDLRPPTVTVLHAGHTGDGYLFLAPSSGPGQRGTLILDNRGDVVWFHPTTPHAAMNLRAGMYKGEPVLTWWEGQTELGLGHGTHVILDSSYRVVARVPAGRGRPSDLHEFRLTPHGTALVTSYETRTMDLTAFGGTHDGKVVGGIVQEIEIPSARVLFEWRSLDHVPLEESHATPGRNSFDYFHVNSIDIDGDRNLIVSARNTWTVYKLSRRTGRIIWRLGGRKSDFTMGPGTVFAWQHDAHHQAAGRRISIFDDGAAPAVEPQSRVLVIDLDLKRMRATLVHKYTHHPQRLLAHYMGSAQLLDNGNVVVGWGSEPYITEFDRNGTIQFDAKLPHGGQNYRAFRFPWVGRPSVPPRLVAQRAKGVRTLYVSWNGATEVASWQLEAGATADALTAVSVVPRQTFETTLVPPAGVRYAAAVPLDRSGKPLGRSETVRV
ncbi:MAG: arylsulfotransferase family protein [Gaiellaceae bacterium]